MMLKFAEARLQIAALGIDVRDAETPDCLVRCLAAIDADAAVTRAVGTMEAAAVSVGIADRFAEVAFLRLDLLNANRVGVLHGQPLEKAFVDCRTYAV